MKTSIIIFSITVYLLLSPISRAQWTQTNFPYNGAAVYSLAVSDTYIFAGTAYCEPEECWGSVYKSTNNGTSWTPTLDTNGAVFSLAVNGNNVFAGTSKERGGGRIYKSTDNGTSWTPTLNTNDVGPLAVNGNYVFAGFWGYGVYRSTDNGQTWMQTPLIYRTIYSLAASGSYVFAGTGYLYGYGVYRSTDNGQTWMQTPLNNRTIYSLAVSGSNVFAGTDSSGLYLSTNNGQNWNQTGLNNLTVYSLAVSGSNVFAGTEAPYGVYRSTNNGANWTQWNEGLANQYVWRLALNTVYIFAVTTGSMVWKRLLSDTIVGIKSIGSSIPEKYNLYQNYPNPFNPATTIKFGIPKESRVKLVIYDILGREITTLVNEQLQPGSYEVECDASNYSSGIYFYRIAIHSDKLTSENYSETKRMVLIK